MDPLRWLRRAAVPTLSVAVALVFGPLALSAEPGEDVTATGASQAAEDSAIPTWVWWAAIIAGLVFVAAGASAVIISRITRRK